MNPITQGRDRAPADVRRPRGGGARSALAVSEKESRPMTIVAARPRAQTVLIDTLRRLALENGRPLSAVLRDYAGVGFGPGKLTFDEFVALRLYDGACGDKAALQSFIGLRGMRGVWGAVNYRQEFHELIRNKIGLAALLEAHGFPAIPVRAVFRTTAGFATATSLHTVEALRRFLMEPTHYPLFGKPVNGFQSLGSASFTFYDAKTGMLDSLVGAPRPLANFVEDIATHYADGYIFQPRIAPHPDIRAICGERLATVRVMTVFQDGEPHILRACEKIPAGGNVADNYWRPGNLLVQLDIETGTRKQAGSGTGFGWRAHTHHPDSGAAITGTSVPNWARVCELAREGARLFPETPLLGWDIAPVEEGAAIVEANVTPDPMLPQMADRKGLMDARMKALLAERRRSLRDWIRHNRKIDEENDRQSFWN